MKDKEMNNLAELELSDICYTILRRMIRADYTHVDMKIMLDKLEMKTVGQIRECVPEHLWKSYSTLTKEKEMENEGKENCYTAPSIEEAKNLFSKLEEKIITVARVSHQANKAYCEALLDFSQKNWEQAPDWQKASSIQGVQFMMEKKLRGEPIIPGVLHENWMDVKIKDGWTYGKVKDAVAKTHPCLVPFEELPEDQKVKDKIFYSLVFAILFN